MGRYTMLPINTDRKPIVSIVGAGIAGLTLAILLEKQGVQYNIYERAKEIRPLGSAISLGPNVASVFKQIGIYDQFVDLAKLWNSIQIYNDELEHQQTMDFSAAIESQGGPGYIIARPALYQLLLDQIPKERLHLNQRVLSFLQNKNGVMIRTSDNKTHDADILVGADGAYSAVRQGLYADLKAEGGLPPSDLVPLPFTCVCLVGQTHGLDPEMYPQLKMEETQFVRILGENSPYSLSTFTTKQNTICWSMVQFLDKESSKMNDSFRSSEWGLEAADAMCKEVSLFPILGAAPDAKEPLRLGDLIEQTPKELISKVMLEEKVFETWHSGRTVLMGDACHKVNPAGGQGAMNAIHDAICLANWISVLPSTELQDVQEIFKEYKQERYPLARDSFENSQMFRNLNAKTFKAKMMRYASKNMPIWLWKMIMSRMILGRPQVSFLPLVQDLGTTPPMHQPSLHKTLELARVKEHNTITKAV